MGMMHIGKQQVFQRLGNTGENPTQRLDDLQQIMNVLRGKMVRFTSEVAGFGMKFAQWIPMMGKGGGPKRENELTLALFLRSVCIVLCFLTRAFEILLTYSFFEDPPLPAGRDPVL